MSERKVIVIPDGKICDYITGKFRKDTPEEYVRQTIEKWSDTVLVQSQSQGL